MEKSHCQAIFNNGSSTSNIVSCVEFRQCEVDGWMMLCDNKGEDQNTHESTTIININSGGPQKLIVSCTQQEFRKFAEGRLLMTNKNESTTTTTTTSIRELHLVLHFMLADVDIQHLIFTLEKNQSLEHLSIEYLDLDDNTWTNICKSLHNHPNLKILSLAYTENFSDNYRRLTPERCRSRTTDIIELLNTNKTLQEIDWPKFQQDESLIPDIERLLMENRRAASSSSNND